MASSQAIPKTMKAIQLVERFAKYPDNTEDWSKYLKVAEVPVPKPKKGELLVKVERSPCNPSDLSSLKGTYGKGVTLPYIPGFEGSGVAVANGGGFYGWSMLGKRVAGVGSGGFWAEYVTVPASNCIALPDNVPFDVGASCFVNPFTALAFADIAHARGDKYILISAAASALGKMIIKISNRLGFGVIALVRRQEQVEALLKLGAKQVFDTSSKDWEQELTESCKKHSCKLAFDAVAGSLTGKILQCMPPGSVIKVYGGLSEQACTVSPIDLVFQDKKVEGFWLSAYIKTKYTVGLLKWQKNLKELIKTDLKSDVQGEYRLEQFGAALLQYTSNMSAGKILIAPTKLEKEDKE